MANQKDTEYSYIEDNFLNVKRCFDGIIETTDGRFITAVEVEPINFKFKTGDEQDNIITYFEKWLKIAPVSFQIKTVSKKTDVNKIVQKADREFEKLPNKEAIRYIHNDEVDMIKRLGSRTGIERFFYVIIEYSPTDNFVAKNEEDICYYLNSVKNSMRKMLSSCGNTVLTHRDSEYYPLELLYKVLNKNKTTMDMYDTWDDVVSKAYDYCDGDEEKLDQLPTPYNTIISPNEINIHDDYVVIDGVYYSYMYIPSREYPTHIAASWLSGLINSGEGINVDIFVRKQEKFKIKDEIRRSTTLNSVRKNQTKNVEGDRYRELSKSVSAGQYILEQMSHGDSVYYISTLITVSADNYDDLYNKNIMIKELMDAIDVDLVECNYMMDSALRSTLPLNNIETKLFNKSKRNITTSDLAGFYPFTSYEVSDEDGVVMGVNADNSSLCVLDIYNTEKYKNANMAILGTSGAGKTFLLSTMLKRFRMKGIDVFIIAPLKGHEFYKVCKAIGGQFIRLSSGSQNCINIMEIRPVDKSSKKALGILDDEDEIILNKKVDNLLIFFSLIVPDISYEEKQLLDDALLRTYALKGITKDNKSLIDHVETYEAEDGTVKTREVYKEMPILEDLHKVLEKSKGCERIANILKRYTTGSASSFNGYTNVDLDNPFTVVDISSLSEELIPVGMFIALDFIYDKAKEDITKKKAIAIDEAWMLIKSNPLAAHFVVEIFKIIRGYGGAAIAASQDIKDFFSLNGGEFGKAIISNSKTKIILNLEPDEAETVQSTLNLSNKERKDIEMFERGQALVVSNSSTFSLDFIASDLEKTLVTTDRAELERLAKRGYSNIIKQYEKL